MGKGRLTGPKTVSRRRGLRRALLLAAFLSLLLPASAAAADTEITGGPAEDETIADRTPTFTFTSPDVFLGFECQVDGGGFAPCGSLLDNSFTTTELVDGPHTFAVRAVDLLGPDDTPATRNFTVDGTGPTITSVLGPSGPTNDPTPRFDFSADEPGSTFECRVDGSGPGGWAPCEGPGGDSHIVDPPLGDGPHTFEVRAIDTLGNVGAPAPPRGFIVDTDDPNTTIDSGPGGVTRDDTPTFEFSSNEPGSTFQCRVDGGAFGPCSGPGDEHTTAPLADGPHSFEVRATDAAGNRDEDPPIRTFTVDTTPPNTTIDSGPVGTVSDDTPTFTFSSNDGVRFECRVDGGPFGSCSGPEDAHTTAPLSDGEHSFDVRAFDAVDNADPTPATRSFTVDTSLPPDTTAPETTITKRPKNKIKTKKKKAKVKVAFRSEPGAAFTCRLDKGEYEPCTSPYVVKAKAKGGKGKKHRVSIRATDSAGNTGDPAAVSFRVLRAPRLGAARATRTVVRALRTHGFARRVMKSLRIDCNRRGRAAFGCRFSSRFPGYRLKGSGEVKLRARLSYRFRVKAQGVRFTLTDRNETR